MKKLSLSIIIATYNRADLLPFCLDALAKQNVEADSFEIVLIDNNCTDGTMQVWDAFVASNSNLNTAYFLETNQGLSYARNRGIEEANHPLLTFLDDDAEVAPDFVEKIIAYFTQSPQTDAIGGIILPKYLGGKPQWLSKHIANIFGYYAPSKQAFIYSSKDYPRGSNMSFRHYFFDSVGLFSTNLGRTRKNFLGGEERELFERAYRKNCRVQFEPSISCDHLIPEARTRIPVVRQQVYGIGFSKRLVYLNQGKSLLSLYLDECVKLMASVVLCISLCLQGRPKAGLFLIRFRFWIFQGIGKEDVVR